MAKIKKLMDKDIPRWASLTPEMARLIFTYDPETGRLTVGNILLDVYGEHDYEAPYEGPFVIHQGHRYNARRVAFMLHHGREPHGWFVSLNGDDTDLRITNIKDAPMHGSHLCKVLDGWLARLYVKREMVLDLVTQDEESARIAYQAARLEHYGY
jgi:hypothetical protein